MTDTNASLKACPLRDAAYALLAQWNVYRSSDLSQMNAHDILVRYELWNALDAALSRTPPESSEPSARPFQQRVGDWMEQCFTPTIIADKLERADRFIEESLELVQATGYCADRAHALVEYVFGRPIGEAFQEVGGVRVTLAALCNPHGIDEESAAEAELARVWTKIEKIRAKQATKPVGSALPIPTPPVQS